MRVFFGAMATETNTFSSFPTGMDAFIEGGYYPAGSTPDDATFSRGLLAIARERAKSDGWQLFQGLMTFAMPGGRMPRVVYERLRDQLLNDLKQAQPLDMVLLTLHGAMVAENVDDCEDDILARIRALVGPDAIIGATLDPHCHLTQAMTANANLLICYKEYPHTDGLERAIELVDLCVAAAARKIEPVCTVIDCEMALILHTTREPMRSLVDKLQLMERSPGVLSISIAHGFPWGDVVDMGTRVMVYTDADAQLGQHMGRSIHKWLRTIRVATLPACVNINTAISTALASESGPVVLADIADNPGGGAPGDSTFILRELLTQRVQNAVLGPLWDPIAVRTCFAAGPSASLELRIGGKMCALSGDPLDVKVRIKRLLRSTCMTDLSGAPVSLGDAALVEIDGIEVVLTTLRHQAMNVDLFTQFGICLQDKKIIVVKSSQHFHASFAPIAALVLYVDAPGVVQTDFRTLPYQKARKHIWPLNTVNTIMERVRA